MSVNLSHKINPFNYGSGGTVEVVMLECSKCDFTEKKRLPHATSDTVIMTKHFNGWKARGYRNQRRTLCPKCANDQRQATASEKP